MKTLAVYEYRGRRVFLRNVHKELFEYLIPWGKKLYCNQFLFAKKRGEKTRQYTEDELAHIIDSLKYIANAFIDDEKFKRSPRIIQQLWQNTAVRMFSRVFARSRMT